VILASVIEKSGICTALFFRLDYYTGFNDEALADTISTSLM
jgi:hypothetical protein